RDEGSHLDDVADRPRLSEQGRGRHREGGDARRNSSVRDREAHHHSRRSRGMTGADSYSPQFRTALVLTGTGTAGAYHAGVLRALHEAGVKLDVVAGRGMGAVGALFAAVDGGQNLWREKGFWRPEGLRSLYEWRTALRVAGWAVAAAFAIVALPMSAVAVG